MARSSPGENCSALAFLIKERRDLNPLAVSRFLGRSRLDTLNTVRRGGGMAAVSLGGDPEAPIPLSYERPGAPANVSSPGYERRTAGQ